VKYKDLIAELKKYELVREEELVENSTMTRDQIHQDIYHLSKKWDFKPLILFHSSYYLYVSSGIVEDLLKMLKEVSSKKRKLKEVLKNMMEEYGFKSKKEATDVIGHLRKHMD